MIAKQNQPPKGLLARLIRAVGVEPTEEILFKTRVGIVIVCLVFVGYEYVTKDTVANKYGNYEHVKEKLPR